LNESSTGAKVEQILDRDAKPKKIVMNRKAYDGPVDFGQFFDLNTLKTGFVIPKKQKSNVEATY